MVRYNGIEHEAKRRKSTWRVKSRQNEISVVIIIIIIIIIIIVLEGGRKKNMRVVI